MGNHDYLPYSRELSQSQREDGIARLKEAEAAFGWQMLDNGNVNLYRTDGDCISVIGIENLSAKGNFQSYGDIDRASAGADGGFKILISHDPSAWEPFIAGKRDIDLTLSGHTHDMQVSFFGYTPSALIYEQHSGLYSSTYLSGDEEFPQYLYVNTGLGETVFPARIGVPPEISLLVLRRK
ncbi:MAG: metallophosphoesterase [Candidatus Cryptobacteroides sp.]